MTRETKKDKYTVLPVYSGLLYTHVRGVLTVSFFFKKEV